MRTPPPSGKYITFLYLTYELFRKKINWCHQMSYFKAKMYQIRFPLGLYPRHRWAYSASQDPLAAFMGAYFKARGKGKERGRREMEGGGERKGREEENDLTPPLPLSQIPGYVTALRCV